MDKEMGGYWLPPEFIEELHQVALERPQEWGLDDLERRALEWKKPPLVARLKQFCKQLLEDTILWVAKKLNLDIYGADHFDEI